MSIVVRAVKEMGSEFRKGLRKKEFRLADNKLFITFRFIISTINRLSFLTIIIQLLQALQYKTAASPALVIPPLKV
jgi:hypothetical protein